ncbi:hypothetical protein [Stenotrophomonas sp.]|uniref:hypothetical protein n=1 Tax=Stenotrophomonas sp. TaxID=69392 RepID=UPI0028B1D9CA|nr:hypothetical protein [Stenotrophomonas sp.]
MRGIIGIILGGFLSYVPLLKLNHYLHNGAIVFNHQRGGASHGTEAAFWNLAWLGIGLWLIAASLVLLIKGKAE